MPKRYIPENGPTGAYAPCDVTLEVLQQLHYLGDVGRRQTHVLDETTPIPRAAHRRMVEGWSKGGGPYSYTELVRPH